MVDVKAAAEAAGVSQCAIRMRMCRNRKRGEADLLKADLRGGNYKMTEAQAIQFWQLVKDGGITTENACQIVGITKFQGENIRSGKTWNSITGKPKDVVYIGSSSDPINIAADKYGVSRKAILDRIRKNKKRGFSGDDLFKIHPNKNFKVTEDQAIKFWHLVAHEGMATKKACDLVGISTSQGDNIRSGKTWNRITGKVKVVYGDY